MDTDIVIFAVLAVIVFAKLWSVLGRRNEGDTPAETKSSFTPFAPKPTSEEEDDAPFRLEGRKPDNELALGDEQKKTPNMPLAPLFAPTSLAGKLEKIKQLDPNFNEKAFLLEARHFFTTVISSFAKGDLSAVKAQLGPKVLPRFEAALAARSAAGHFLENTLLRINDVETISADVEDGRASITVRYVSEQKNITRDAEGFLVDGSDKIEEITDIWTFARDMTKIVATWTLTETKS